MYANNFFFDIELTYMSTRVYISILVIQPGHFAFSVA